MQLHKCPGHRLKNSQRMLLLVPIPMLSCVFLIEPFAVNGLASAPIEVNCHGFKLSNETYVLIPT
eukprot:scaffold390822_cov79-Cyclotella_meneghiniana.AAC.1